MKKCNMDDDGFEIAMLIKEIDSNIYNIVLKELKGVELTPQQMTIMKHLGHHGEMTVSDICNAMCLTKGTVSGILNRMEKQNFIKKVKYEEDKRNTYITFTEEGLIIGRQVMVKFNQAFNNIFKSTSKEKLKEVKSNLKEIIQMIKESE